MFFFLGSSTRDLLLLVRYKNSSFESLLEIIKSKTFADLELSLQFFENKLESQ